MTEQTGNRVVIPQQIGGRTSEIIKRIEKGECTLFLGAGASLAAGAPTGRDLSSTIIQRFLSHNDWPMSLDHAFSLARAYLNPMDIENFMRDELSTLKPSQAHKRIPWFKWRALITTNYDQLIEDAYKEEKGRVQQPLAIHDENDLPKVGYPNEEYVPLLKPHGCISDCRNMSMGVEGIHRAKNRRRLIFSYIEMLHLAGPVIYIGYSLNDSHILDMICDLRDRLGRRTNILFVTMQDEDKAKIEQTWLTTLGVEYLNLGFEGFMNYISQELKPAIGASKIVPQLHSCRIYTFPPNAAISYRIQNHSPTGAQDEWECWWDYVIDRTYGYAGIGFEAKNEPLDLSQYKTLSFELNVSESPRLQPIFEGIKLEGYNSLHHHEIDTNQLPLGKWEKITLDFDQFAEGAGQLVTLLRQVVFADNSNLALNNQRYSIGIRNVKFESKRMIAEAA